MEEMACARMCATVLQVCRDRLLVCDDGGCRRVVVHTEDACRFCRGDRVCIRYSGAMTNSLPPHLTAESVSCLCRD